MTAIQSHETTSSTTGCGSRQWTLYCRRRNGGSSHCRCTRDTLSHLRLFLSPCFISRYPD
ncbi:hypothetical protein Hanom_Chr07g00613081 [Helianthus anomalus]